jgi:hypothetical protein
VAYEDAEHLLVTRGFLASPQRTLSLLMEEDVPAPDQALTEEEV